MKKSKDLIEILGKRIEEMRNSEELGTLINVTHTNAKGGNVFQDLLKSVEGSDKENDGKTSRFLDWMVDKVEDGLGIDLEDGLMKHLENINKESKTIENKVKDIFNSDTLKDNSVKSVFEQIAEFANKGPRSVFDTIWEKALSHTDINLNAESKEMLEKFGKVIKDNEPSDKKEIVDWIDKKMRSEIEKSQRR